MPATEKVERPEVVPDRVEPPAEYITQPLGSVLANRPGSGYRPGRPLEIEVPRLHVDSQVDAIRSADGALVPPSDPRTIGWWRGGARPGAAEGAAVLTGHTVSVGGGAFDKLGELVSGDEVSVRTRHGWIHYEVASVKDLSVPVLSKKASSLFSADGPGRLVLVTCSEFDGTEYLANTVVVAVPVAPPDDEASGSTASPAPSSAR